jgi:hypothetical protein
MGTLMTLIFGGDTYRNASTGWDEVTPVPATLEVGLTEADFSNKNLGPGGATIISAWISHKDNGAISTLTFGDKQAVTMTTEMTEANFSGKLYSSDAQIVAAFLPKCT